MTVSEYNKAVDLYADNIYRFVIKHLSDKEKAKDIVQDVFEKVWLKIDTVNFDKIKSYLFSAAYRTMIDSIRKNKKMESTPDYNNVIMPTHENHYSDLSDQLELALNTLPEIQKTVILLRDYEGYSYQEIGEIASLKESQVKVYIYRARKSLQNYLVKMEYLL